MKRVLIFDFGGVLMKTMDPTARRTWTAALGLQDGELERVVHGSESWHLAQCGLLSPEAYWADVAAQLRLDPGQLARLQHDYFSGDRLDQALTAYIRQQRAAGHRVALLSNDSPALLQKLDGLGIAPLFDPIVISAQIGVMKPAPEAYRAVLGQMNVQPQDAIFIDDMPGNVEGARAVGLHAIHYTPLLDLPTALAPLLTV